ncbi:hypothetical protein [Nostoc sp.]
MPQEIRVITVADREADIYDRTYATVTCDRNNKIRPKAWLGRGV